MRSDSLAAIPAEDRLEVLRAFVSRSGRLSFALRGRHSEKSSIERTFRVTLGYTSAPVNMPPLGR